MKGKNMIHTPDISKDFILNTAVRDATNILLRPYMPVVLESCSTPNDYKSKYETINRIKDRWILYSQDFLLRMATIAWDFLNVLTMFQSNSTNQSIGEEIPDNDI